LNAGDIAPVAAGAVHSGRLLGRFDLHVHTTMSDGEVELAEIVRIADALGVQVGIADHVSARNRNLFVSTPEKLDRYIEALDGLPVFRSGELCWRDSFSESIPDEIIERFDYLIGSNHGFTLPDGSVVSPWSRVLPPHWAAAPQHFMEIWVQNLCDLVAVMPIDIVAHPTLLPPALLSLEGDVFSWWTEEREDRFVEATVRAGVALEISNRYRLPHDRLLKRAREAGARFTLGSDGHQRHQIARLEWAIQAAGSAGIDDDRLFVPNRA
jgi:histidinol phosphatase-like PHP family hydrolase